MNSCTAPALVSLQGGGEVYAAISNDTCRHALSGKAGIRSQYTKSKLLETVEATSGALIQEAHLFIHLQQRPRRVQRTLVRREDPVLPL